MTTLDTLVNIEDEMRQSYMDYAMSVIVGRALPEVRDGLKPVQRRILFAMFEEGHLPGRKHSKCAGVVGEVLKRLHPHGDSSVYDALVRLAQPWALRYPLVDGQGNFGSIDGDPPAAYRYTECRMTVLSERLLADIDKDTVEHVPNFDESSDEPVVLPSVIPNLLVNGADGIAVGMATHMPPHNLREIINAAVEVIRDPDVTIDALMRHVSGPDFPTGGIIFGRGPIRSAYSTGKGVLQVRAKTEIERLKINNREVDAIVVTEIPFQVNKSRLIEKIAELVNGRDVEGISRLRDESDRSGMRIVMELKRDATPEVVLNQLFKSTPLQVSFGVINLAIVRNKPVVCTLKQLLLHFVDHRRDVVTRRTRFELRKADERLHVLEGFRLALVHIDEIIVVIKAADDAKQAKDDLVERFSFSDVQAQAILELRLQRLTGLERLAVDQEIAKLTEEAGRLRMLLSDPVRVDDLIVSELEAVKEEFGDERRTVIVDDDGEILLEDMIEEEEVAVTISRLGYIRRTALSEYRAQRRGGRGVTGASSKDDDFIEHLFVANTHADLLVFTTEGKLYWQKVYQIPESGRTSRGRALVNLLSLGGDEKVTSVLTVRRYEEGRFVVLATKAGVVKKVPLMDFSRVRKAGLIACTLDEGDTLIGAGVSSGSDDVILSTRSGQAVRFAERRVRPMGRTARGVKGVTFASADDAVVSMVIVPGEEGEGADVPEDTGAEAAADEAFAPAAALADAAEPETSEPADAPEVSEGAGGDVAAEDEEADTLLTVSEYGYGKRTPLRLYPVKGRGGRGVRDIRTDERNGGVVRAFVVSKDSNLMLITSSGKIIRLRAEDVRLTGRNTLGVRLVNLEEGERVVAVTHVVEGDDEIAADE